MQKEQMIYPEKAIEQDDADTESLLASIALALAADYYCLYYVDLDTDRYVEYRSDAARGVLVAESSGKDFFNQSRIRAQSLLYPDDVEMFLNTFKKEIILGAMDEHSTYTLTYRLMQDGEPVYMNMKVSRMNKKDHHIVIGISNVDAQMRYQEAAERAQEEQATFARVAALAGDFIVIYTVNPETEHYNQYSATREYETLGIPAEGEEFFATSRREAMQRIHPEDLDRFDSLFVKDNVLREIEQSGVFAVTYRMIINGESVYVTTRGAIIREKDGPQLIIGVNNVDAQVRREMEYEHNLSVAQTKASIDALTGVRNKHAYIEMEMNLNNRIAEEPDIQFAILSMDVNNLKKVNDTQGHAAGDRLLKQACGIICRIFAHSAVFRTGGDEFTVISQGDDYKRIEELIELLRENNEKNAGTGEPVIASGLARYEPGQRVQDVYDLADNLMYNEKKRLKALYS